MGAVSAFISDAFTSVEFCWIIIESRLSFNVTCTGKEGDIIIC